MAEGGKWSRSFLDSFSRASGDADETFCDPCKSEDNYIAVGGYCQTCGEYLCEPCLIAHRKLKITRAHVILDKKQMPSGQRSVSNKDLCVELCKTHHPEIIRFYCKAHDEAGCGDCMTLDHTACKKDRVQDISNGFQRSKEFKDIDQHLQQLHQELEEMGGELDNNLKNLDRTYSLILQNIASVRTEINEYLDRMQKKVRDEAEQMKKDDERDLKTLQAENQAIKAEIEAMLQTLHDSNVNASSLFVTTKQAKHRLITMETEINIMKQPQQQQQQQYEFHISDEIANIVSAKTPLGKLSRRSAQKKRETTKKQDEKTPRTPRTPSIDTTATYNRTPSIDITATHIRSINVKQKTDKKTCFIHDCTLLSADSMVVTDDNNKNVKLINISNNTVISTYSPSSTPYGVTTLRTNMIAVTLRYERKIQVLNVTTTFTLQREIKVNKNCCGIAYKDGKFAVSYVNPGRVDILDIQGKILHTIQPKQWKDDILKYPEYIIFGHDNDTVIVSDWKRSKVSIITFSGQILCTYTHDTLRLPQGIVMTADGVLYVCSWGGGCIHAVSPDFKTSKIIINKDGHVVLPQSITYSEMSHRLYVSNTALGDIDNQIQVYDLKAPV